MIIAITGKKRSGKDVFASILQEHNFELYKFAQPIKNMCKDIFLWNEDYINGDKKEEIDPRWGISPRYAQQVIGTELFRQGLPSLSDGFRETVGDCIWVNRFRYWYDNYKSTSLFGNVVISDLRFLNEAKMVQEYGGLIVKIVRDTDSKSDVHQSEQEMESIISDYTIHNDGTLGDYTQKIYKFLEILDLS